MSVCGHTRGRLGRMGQRRATEQRNKREWQTRNEGRFALVVFAAAAAVAAVAVVVVVVVVVVVAASVAEVVGCLP